MGACSHSFIYSQLFVKCLLYTRHWEAKPYAVSALMALRVSLLECTKCRANVSGLESQILLNPRGPQTEASGTSVPELTSEMCSGRQCWFYTFCRDRSQVHWPRQKGLVHFPNFQTYRSEKNLENESNPFLPLRKTVFELYFARESQSGNF